MAKYPEIKVEASADYSALAIRAHHKMRQAGVPSDECASSWMKSWPP
jgi:hypothetical protein